MLKKRGYKGDCEYGKYRKKYILGGDYVVIFAVLLVWILSFAPFLSGGAAENLRAVIYLDGEKYAEYTLGKYEKPIYVTVEGTGRNVAEISKDGVCVTETDCGDRLEIKEGKISKAGQSLICLPNKFIIKIEGGGEKVDAVTY